MVNDVAKTKKKTLRWWNKRSDDQFGKANSKREKYISILQKRYGYNKEKATSELDENYPKAILY